MERKVNFTNQGLNIAVITISVNVTAGESSKLNLLNQLPQLITDKTARDLHNSECAVPGLSNMTDAQNVCIQLLKFLTQFVRWWRLEIRWKRIAVGHG